MAKKRKTKEKASSKPSATTSAPSTMDDDDLQVLFFQHKNSYVAALAKKKKADADFKNACKLAKSELKSSGMADAVDRIKLAILLETDEGDASLKERLENELRVARWMGTSVGTQFSLFDGPDRTPAVDRAFDDGKRAGLSGEPAKPPHSPDTEQYRRWMAGHSEGNTALATKGFKAPAGTFREVADAGDAHIQEHSAKMSAAADSLTH